MKTVIFHGAMAKKYGKRHQFAFANWFQLLGGLVSRFGVQIKEEIAAGKWHVTDGAAKQGNDLSEVDIQKNKALTKKTLHLIPAVEVSSSVLRIVIGVVLIVVGTFVPGMQWLVPIGISLAIGGVVEMLTKQPTIDTNRVQQDGNASSIYNSAKNVTTQGGPLPLVYGTVERASSVVISSNFSADEIV